MHFDSIQDFFHMGGYAFYVWLSYGFCVVTLATIIISSVRRRKQIREEIVKSLDRQTRIQQAKEADLL